MCKEWKPLVQIALNKNAAKYALHKNVTYANLNSGGCPYNLPPTDRSRSIADRKSYLTPSVLFSSHFYEKSMNVPAELTIVPVKELFVQIRLARTNPPASLDTVKAAEIRELLQRLRQQQEKHHLKVNICAIVNIFRLFILFAF